jgi:sugar phosphate isomerase/epimerase
MRLGTTSYIYPADILTNVQRLLGTVEDVELVIFESDDHGCNYPDAQTVRALRDIASAHDLTFTIHLPLDLRLADETPLLHRALAVFECTRDLPVQGYVAHMDGVPGTDIDDPDRWLEHSVKSLHYLADVMGGLDKLCVENLENQTPEMVNSLLAAVPVPCCVDIGHLWKQGIDPVPHLHAWLPRARVVHLHGVGTRDHKGLSLMSEPCLDEVVGALVDGFRGVLTFEVFNEPDLLDCMDAFRRSMARVRPVGVPE